MKQPGHIVQCYTCAHTQHELDNHIKTKDTMDDRVDKYFSYSLMKLVFV